MPPRITAKAPKTPTAAYTRLFTREDAFHRLEQLPLKYLDAHAYGEIVSRVVADVDTFADGLLMGFTQLFTGVMTIFGTLALRHPPPHTPGCSQSGWPGW